MWLIELWLRILVVLAISVGLVAEQRPVDRLPVEPPAPTTMPTAPTTSTTVQSYEDWYAENCDPTGHPTPDHPVKGYEDPCEPQNVRDDRCVYGPDGERLACMAVDPIEVFRP